MTRTKKLKLYGERKILGPFKKKGFVAEVWVENGELRVRSKNKNLERELYRVISQEAKRGGVLGLQYTKTKEYPSGYKSHIHFEKPLSITDSNFLDALRDYSALWNAREFAGYKISGVLSEIMEV